MTIFLPIFSAHCDEIDGHGQCVCRTAYTSRKRAEEESDEFKDRCLESCRHILYPSPAEAGHKVTFNDSTAEVKIMEIELDQCES